MGSLIHQPVLLFMTFEQKQVIEGVFDTRQWPLLKTDLEEKHIHLLKSHFEELQFPTEICNNSKKSEDVATEVLEENESDTKHKLVTRTTDNHIHEEKHDNSDHQDISLIQDNSKNQDNAAKQDKFENLKKIESQTAENETIDSDHQTKDKTVSQGQGHENFSEGQIREKVMAKEEVTDRSDLDYITDDYVVEEESGSTTETDNESVSVKIETDETISPFADKHQGHTENKGHRSGFAKHDKEPEFEGLKGEVMHYFNDIKDLFSKMPSSEDETNRLFNILTKYIQVTKLFSNTIDQFNHDAQDICETQLNFPNSEPMELKSTSPRNMEVTQNQAQTSATVNNDTNLIKSELNNSSSNDTLLRNDVVTPINPPLPLPIKGTRSQQPNVTVGSFPKPMRLLSVTMGCSSSSTGSFQTATGHLPLTTETTLENVTAKASSLLANIAQKVNKPEVVKAPKVDNTSKNNPVYMTNEGKGVTLLHIGNMPTLNNAGDMKIIPVMVANPVSEANSLNGAIPIKGVTNLPAVPKLNKTKDQAPKVSISRTRAKRKQKYAEIAKLLEKKTMKLNNGQTASHNQTQSNQIQTSTIQGMLTSTNSHNLKTETNDDEPNTNTVMWENKSYPVKDNQIQFENDRPLQCPYCTKRFFKMKRVNSHIVLVHPEHSPDYVCYTCKVSYKNRLCLYAHRDQTGHQIIGPQPSIMCELCGKVLKSKLSYNFHSKHVHSQEYNVICEICSRAFKSDQCLKAHKKQVHVFEETECDICKKVFSNRKHMRDHRTRHTGARKQVCKECGKAFFQKAALDIHMLTHTGEKPWQCTQCTYRCTTKPNLVKHMKTHYKHLA